MIEPKVAVVIPARYKSSRFPGKPLKILGTEMIIWVAGLQKMLLVKIMFISQQRNEEIVDLVKSHGYKVVLTSDSCPTGTDRVAEGIRD